MEGAPQQPQFKTPEEEIAYLRGQIAARERDLLARNTETDQVDLETAAKEEVKEYIDFRPQTILHEDHQMPEDEVVHHAEQLSTSSNQVEEVVRLATTEGIRNAMSVVEKIDNGHIIDEVHRSLIELIKSGKKVQDLKEGVPPWQVLNTTLFEVALSEFKDTEDKSRGLSELVSMMEQFYAGMQAVSVDDRHYTIEVATSAEDDNIVFYVAVPNTYIDLFEKQTLSLFPNAVITEQKHDYNIFAADSQPVVSVIEQRKHPIYPLKTYDTFESDPIHIILNAFSKIEDKGGGASFQVVIKGGKSKRYYNDYEEVVKRVRKGMKPKDSIKRITVAGDILLSMGDLILKSKKESEDMMQDTDQDAIEVFTEKISTPITETNMRIVVSSPDEIRSGQIMTEIEAVFHQFENTRGNSFKFRRLTKGEAKRELKAFSFREFLKKRVVPLSFKELATVVHFPGEGIESPQFKQSRAKTAPAPLETPQEGTLLGINKHRGSEKEIYITEKDRMRHFYIIGQTGTGKSVFMKNLIIQDIQQGNGVCMIDPHGTDIEDVLAAVPPEREEDVIYFDPSNLDHVIGLNMLEYDRTKPEQKTFVVNELFSIFQKLYGGNPESMGPMFEQYFRNATLLVMEHPESGNTLMDISRVMADAKYRRMKLENANNPVVVQFWKEIATKAGGEASLENIVPYIVSKFDVFTANDYMRPIIGQQESAFNFREIMDTKKILLVNLSKGRLGEINANLIGMIIVGKLLMAALSRVDTPSMDFPPFYLHIDEFQNVSTPSIASILSEARKYKLGLVVAHQFIAQLDDDIRDAVFGNVGSMAIFRVGPEDGQTLEKQLDPVFDANDIMNIENYNAYFKVLANGVPTKPFSAAAMAPLETDLSRVAHMLAQSMTRYGRPRAEIEAEIAERYKKEEPAAPQPGANPFEGLL